MSLFKFNNISNLLLSHRALHGFGQAKFAQSGSVLGLSQFTQLPKPLLKMKLDLKMLKIDSKIIISFS